MITSHKISIRNKVKRLEFLEWAKTQQFLALNHKRIVELCRLRNLQQSKRETYNAKENWRRRRKKWVKKQWKQMPSFGLRLRWVFFLHSNLLFQHFGLVLMASCSWQQILLHLLRPAFDKCFEAITFKRAMHFKRIIHFCCPFIIIHRSRVDWTEWKEKKKQNRHAFYDYT